MCQFNNITEFNTYLSDNLKNIKLNEYFNLIHSQFYSKIDISFMDYFLELTNHENEFIVDHIKLQEYGVINTIKSIKNFEILNHINIFRLIIIDGGSDIILTTLIKNNITINDINIFSI